jgi:hypothetical protein
MHIFLTSALVGGEWSVSRPSHFTSGGKASGTHWMGGWVGPRAGLDDVEKRKFLTLPGLELRPVRSPSLYRLSYGTVQSWYSLECFQGLQEDWQENRP